MMSLGSCPAPCGLTFNSRFSGRLSVRMPFLWWTSSNGCNALPCDSSHTMRCTARCACREGSNTQQYPCGFTYTLHSRQVAFDLCLPRLQPHDLLVPAKSLSPDFMEICPQSHSQVQWVLFLPLPSTRKPASLNTTSQPNRWPVKSILFGTFFSARHLGRVSINPSPLQSAPALAIAPSACGCP